MNQDRYTLTKLFTQTGCISQDALMKYADGKLSAEEARKVELHLVDCPLCDEALDGILACGTAEFAEMVAEVAERVDESILEKEDTNVEDGKVIEFRPNIMPPAAATKRGGFRKFVPYFGIAASIALIAVFSIFLLRDTSGKIADRHFELMDGSTSRSVRGVDNAPEEDKQAQALELFENAEYQKAADLFDKDSDIRSALFAGDCYYQLGKYDLAVIRYRKVIDADQGPAMEQAQFKLALTYLKMDEVAQAQMLLEKITADKHHDYYKSAKETLDEVIGL